jgi:CubicO group peptidase (beta-lactamase class C family)
MLEERSRLMCHCRLMSSVLLLVVAALVVSCLGCGQRADSVPWAGWPTEGWPVSTPEEQGMDSGLLADLVEKVAGDGGIDSVTVIRNGYLVVDAVVYPFPEDTSHVLASCTKSVVGTLVGMAIDRGLLAGVDVPAVEILADDAPETVDDLKASMTVEDLLTMSTGLECRDSYLYDWAGMQAMVASDNWVAHVLALPMSEELGARFEYCNGSSMLLSAILSEVTGMSAADFAAEVLLGPLGISDYEWPASPRGVTIGMGGLRLRPDDLAKLGLLYLREGRWEKEQLVPRRWVEDSTAPQIEAGTLSDHYGYQWWVDDSGYVMALGAGGQYLIVVPEQRLVVVFTAGMPGERFSLPEELTQQYVLPAILSDDPLPPAAAVAARLAATISKTGSAPEPTEVVMPPIAAAIDGARYELRPNDSGFEACRISFTSDTVQIEAEFDDVSLAFEPRLDGRYVMFEDPAGGLSAIRAAWQGDDTLVFEMRTPGEVARQKWQMTFDESTVHIEMSDPSDERVLIHYTADRVE